MIQLVHRAGRVVHAAQPPEPILIPPPPQLADTGSQSFPFQMLLPLVGAGSSMLMMTLLRANPIFALLGAVVMVITAVGMLVSLVSRRAGQSRQRRDRRERYLDRLATTHEDATALQRQIRDQAYRTHPAPNALPQWAISPVRRWERRRSHADFLLLRIGTADLVMPSAALPTVGMPAEVDPLLMAEMRSLVRAHEVQPDLPTTINLDCAGEVSIVGPPEATRHVARVLLSQAAVHHAPEDLHLALVYPDQNAQEWDCLARLPHLRMNGVFDGPISRRRVAPTQPALEQLLREEIHEASRQAARLNRTGGRKARPTGPRLLAVVEQEGPASPLTVPDNALDPAAIGATVLYLVTDRLHEPSDPSLRLTIQQDGTVLIEDLRPVSAEPGQPEQTPPPVACRPDDLGPALAEGISRALAPYSLGAAAERQDQDETTTTLAELLGVDDPRAIDPRTAWSPRSPRDFLRVPIGSDDAGSTILLDLKESAQLGVGPHGLCVGATGSGKSELLRTLVAALASTHGPEDLSMILIDYKGGAAFAPFAPLPHVVGLMDNLADDAGLVERARASLAGEVTRRQKQLRDAGSSPDIAHYRRLRAEHPEMAPMPHLFVIIDEFGELLTASPDLVDLLLTIGRIGRSIGVHLLLSSQRIEAG